MASKANHKTSPGKKVSSASAVAVAEPVARSVEAKLVRLLGLPSEAEAIRIVTLLKEHGLNKTQVLALVETIRREERSIIYGESILKGELQTSQEDMMDEADLAASDIDQGMKMRMANRENFKVKRLHRALDSIREGSYGECESCGADIGFQRLLARVIADKCIACKEEEERKENHNSVGRTHKSMGQGMGSKLTVN